MQNNCIKNLKKNKKYFKTPQLKNKKKIKN